jgi:uncharacterized membrane protein YccC
MTLPASRDWLFPVKTFIASMLALYIGLKLRLPRLARAVDDQRNLTARMLDRLMRIITRLAATDDKRHPSVERFRDLHIAFNALDLQRLSRRLGRDRRLGWDSRLGRDSRLVGDEPAALEAVLDGVRGHFQHCLRHRSREPVPPSLRTAIDIALERVVRRGAAVAAEGIPPMLSQGGDFVTYCTCSLACACLFSLPRLRFRCHRSRRPRHEALVLPG